MAVRLEIGWRPELIDAEGEALRRQAQEYFGLTLDRVQVLRLLMLDMELTPQEAETIRTEVFTNPVTQVSSYSPLARKFDYALWVGFRPGVKDNAGAMAMEAVEAFLGRRLSPEAAVYTSKLYLLLRPDLQEDQAVRLARGLLANDLIQDHGPIINLAGDHDIGCQRGLVRLGTEPGDAALFGYADGTHHHLGGAGQCIRARVRMDYMEERNIPGATVAYTLEITNEGLGTTDADSIKVTVRAFDNPGGSGIASTELTAIVTNTNRADTLVLNPSETFPGQASDTAVARFSFVPPFVDDTQLPDTLNIVFFGIAYDPDPHQGDPIGVTEKAADAEPSAAPASVYYLDA